MSEAAELSDYDADALTLTAPSTPAPVDLFREWYGEVGRLVREEAWDFVTAITGRPGTGKSTLAMELGLVTDADFQPRAQVAFTPAEYVRMLRALPGGKTKVGDEWVNAGYNRKHQSRENIETNTVFMTLRGFTGGHHVLNMPNLFSFDPYWRNERISAWLNVKRRGEAILHVPKRSDYKGGEVYWKPVLRVLYPALAGSVWAEYEARKDAYMAWQAERALAVLEESEADAAGGRMDGQEDREARLRRIAEDVSRDAGMFDARGRVRRGMVDAKHEGLTDRELERVAGLASALRKA